MISSSASLPTSIICASVALVTASATTIAYRYFWYREFDDIDDDDDDNDNGNRSYAYWYILQRHNNDQRRHHRNNSIIRRPLRNVTPRPGEEPQIVYLTGIHKQTSEEELLELFSLGGSSPVEVDLSEVSFQKGGGRAWAMYVNARDAKSTVSALQSKNVRGCILCARLERGVEKDGKRISDKTTHTAIIRGIQPRRGTPKKKKIDNNNVTTESKKKMTKKMRKEQQKSIGKQKPHTDTTTDDCIHTYSHNSILIGEIEYPFPSGIYLTNLIQKLSHDTISSDNLFEKENKVHRQQQKQKLHQDEDLLRLLSDVSILGCGSVHKYAKEISEAFAMVDAIERAIKLTFGISVSDLQQPVICYCLGDGKYPMGAAALSLFLPISKNRNNWKFIAIDPLLPKQDESMVTATTATATGTSNATSMFHDRIEMFSGISQDYCIEKRADDSSLLSIAVACHSHAPLEEFWERMPSPKLSVAMPCCAQFSELPKEKPIFEYDNYEVYSPKRRIKTFASI
ncbi:MAG: hypothetical protein ACI8RD_000912 [Bacillariaceae sp.]|jgi:hypothetical protein